MSSNKSWAQIAAKRTTENTSTKPSKSACQSIMIDPPPNVYQPLTSALAMLDIKCAQCSHKIHPDLMDHLLGDKRHLECTGCDTCFPPTGTGPIPPANKQSRPTNSRDATTERIDASLNALLPGNCPASGISSTKQVHPNGPDAASKSPEGIPPMLEQHRLVPHEDIGSFAEEHSCPPKSRFQPDIESEEFANVAFFPKLEQKSRVATFADLFGGSILDDTPRERLGSQAPVGSKIMGGPRKQGQLHKRRAAQDWKQSLLAYGGVATSIFHKFEEDLLRESNARMREG